MSKRRLTIDAWLFTGIDPYFPPPKSLFFPPSLNPNLDQPGLNRNKQPAVSQWPTGIIQQFAAADQDKLLVHLCHKLLCFGLHQQFQAHQRMLLLHLRHSLHQCSYHLLELLLATSEMKQLAKPAIKAQKMEGKAFQSAAVHAAEWRVQMFCLLTCTSEPAYGAPLGHLLPN